MPEAKKVVRRKFVIKIYRKRGPYPWNKDNYLKVLGQAYQRINQNEKTK